jgi:hypothetical protein
LEKTSFVNRPFCKEGEKPEAKQKRLEAKVMIFSMHNSCVFVPSRVADFAFIYEDPDPKFLMSFKSGFQFSECRALQIIM